MGQESVTVQSFAWLVVDEIGVIEFGACICWVTNARGKPRHLSQSANDVFRPDSPAFARATDIGSSSLLSFGRQICRQSSQLSKRAMLSRCWWSTLSNTVDQFHTLAGVSRTYFLCSTGWFIFIRPISFSFHWHFISFHKLAIFIIIHSLALSLRTKNLPFIKPLALGSQSAYATICQEFFEHPDYVHTNWWTTWWQWQTERFFSESATVLNCRSREGYSRRN